MTYGQVARWVWAGLAALVVAAVLIVGGWQAGWWFRAENVKREAKVYDRSYGRQQSLVDQVNTDLTTIASINVQLSGHDVSDRERDVLVAQRVQVGTDACSKLTRVSSPPVELAGFKQTNCDGPTVASNSTLRENG